MKLRVEAEILETINSREELLEEFDEEIFNALVEKIEILIPTHFVFELKSGMRVEEKGERHTTCILSKFLESPII